VREVIAAGQIDDGKTIGLLRDAILPGVIAERCGSGAKSPPRTACPTSFNRLCGP
jgi:hypothetical protein